jgi:hypothetical protein
MAHYFTVVPDGPIMFTDADATDGNVYRLTLMNFGKVPLAFKFQTTAPQLFCCKPVVGFIAASRQMTVDILLKAWKLSPTDDHRQKHSFKLMGYPTDTIDNSAPKTFWTVGKLFNPAKLETRYFDVSIAAAFYRWIRIPNHIGGTTVLIEHASDTIRKFTVNTDECEMQDRSAQTHDQLPHGIQRRATVDRLIGQLESDTATHFWLSRQSSSTAVETDHSISELSVAPEIRHWDSLNVNFM